MAIELQLDLPAAAMTINGLGDCTETLKLFRECSLEQVRDYDLELASKIDKTKEKFREELRTHYKDVLKVTGEVDRLHRELKSGDALFMDLCFKDDLFKLTKLPEFQGTADVGTLGASSSTPFSEAPSQPVLAVSQWVLAVSDMISRFATSYSSSKLFDSVMQGFDGLKSVQDRLEGYREVIRNKCDAFLRFACSPEASFSISQRIQVYNLAVVESDRHLPWDPDLVSKLEQQTFDFILQNHLDDTLRSNDELISSFVAAEQFKQKLSSKLKADISTQLVRLDGILDARQEDLIPSDLPTLSTTGIQELVQDSQYYCMGLVTDRQVEWYKAIVYLIDLIEKLERYGGESLAKELREELIGNLQKGCAAARSDEKPASIRGLVSKIMDDFNRESFNRTIQSTIQSLTA
ncbi:hypothetical protein HG536_0D05650 [Torulaspora globosa]|uniref:Uncharacterized protein n=1 Tax=Torulaspora globosa TaxID=48254 RepID=A0A7G3ZHQ8_9SACH|nr:uncharacterized protein HG536_0D05650 [Torulaspora globosa]QLL33044.1 hypothetical protein HG536_0D05650 [Torulaspora globosa]